jgi:hypothetical protein
MVSFHLPRDALRHGQAAVSHYRRLAARFSETSRIFTIPERRPFDETTLVMGSKRLSHVMPNAHTFPPSIASGAALRRFPNGVALILALGACAALCACSTSNDAHRSGTDAAGDSRAAPYSPCSPETHVGTFTLLANLTGEGGDAQLSGGVVDKVSPHDLWQRIHGDASCALLVGPRLTCSTPCANGEECAGNDQCVASPVAREVGDVDVAGLSAPLKASPLKNGTYYAPVVGAFPPFSPGAPITLTASGGESSGFTLHGAGIEPLQVPAETFAIDTDQPLRLSWQTPLATSGAHIAVSLDLAHHGNVAATLSCDVPDTGSFVIAAELLRELMDEGVSGFPVVTFNRRTVDSTSNDAGCIEFAVASSVERPLTIAGLVSCRCNAGDGCDAPCPEGQTCRTTDSTCQ